MELEIIKDNKKEINYRIKDLKEDFLMNERFFKGPFRLIFIDKYKDFVISCIREILVLDFNLNPDVMLDREMIEEEFGEYFY